MVAASLCALRKWVQVELPGMKNISPEIVPFQMKNETETEWKRSSPDKRSFYSPPLRVIGP